MSTAEKGLLLDFLARGYPPAVCRDRLRKEVGVEITADTVRGYRESNGPEIAQRRDMWLAKLRDEPLAQPRNRLRELARQYAGMVLAEFRRPCKVCLGDGIVTQRDKTGRSLKVVGKGADSEPLQTLCPTCDGRKWMLPEEVAEYLVGLEGDVRLDTLIALGPPPGAAPKFTERAAALLAQIREESGDAWSPRDKGETGPDVDARVLVIGAETAKQLTAALGQVRAAQPVDVARLYEDVVLGRRLKAVKAIKDGGIKP